MAVASTSTYPFHHANDTRTSFKNPWDSALPPTLFELASSPFPLSFSTANPTLLGHRHAKEVGVISPTWKARSDGGEGIDSKGKGSVIKGTWLGHAASFLELPIATEDIAKSKRSVRILFDPVFSWRVGPTPYIGPSRLSASPCTVDDLPGCDIICISHNQSVFGLNLFHQSTNNVFEYSYDHLDAPTILALRSRFPEARYFVPLGLRTFLLDSGVSEEFISELDWWESLDISSLELGFEEGKDTLRLSCVPAQHNSGKAFQTQYCMMDMKLTASSSGRGPRDLASTLWCGWVVESFAASSADGDNPLIRQSSVYFAGWLRLHLGSFYETNRLAVLCSDTGYRRYSTSTEVCPAFKGKFTESSLNSIFHLYSFIRNWREVWLV